MNCDLLIKYFPESLAAELEIIATKYQINTPLRLAHFLAQCAHESGNFRRTVENLNYSKSRLLEVFPKYFNRENVNRYAREPILIASRVYANRMGNRGEESRDGWKYRGRGYLQLTGRDNYAAFNDVVDKNITAEPDLVASKYPLLSAAWFWDMRSLNALADADDIEAITKKVNGGLHGLNSRAEYYNKYIAALNGN